MTVMCFLTFGLVFNPVSPQDAGRSSVEYITPSVDCGPRCVRNMLKIEILRKFTKP